MMLIEITQKMIDEGSEGSCRFCPIANAINSHIDLTKYYTTVGSSTARIRSRANEAILQDFWLPPQATTFIRKFDVFKDVKPISFEIDDIRPQFLKTESNDASQDHGV